MDSVWTQTVQLPRFQPLTSHIKTDILVIGGGIAGLLCARTLTEAGLDCILVEAKTLCGGITQNTTAKITAQHGLIYDRLMRTYDVETARLYLKANLAALERYRVLCRGMDCDFEERDSVVYAVKDRQKLRQELAALERLGYTEAFSARPELPFSTVGGVGFRRQGQFHPLKFAAAIAKGLRIFENTKVLELMPGRAVTGGGVISADKIIVATHFPVLNKHGGYFAKLYQHRSYVLALKNAPLTEEMYVDEAKTGLSFRSWGELLLLGGGGHRTGKQGGGWRELEAFVRGKYPHAQVVARWAAQDCMTLDGIPYIGQYAQSTPSLYTATGFHKWGMTSAMVAAMVLTDLVQGKANPYARVFSPSRTVAHPQLAVNLAQSALHLLTPTVPRCPHMGCALKYNREEDSWDCPCHGSRFARDGTLLDNPATDDKRM